MSILVNKETRVIVQGFTGSQATLHSEQAIDYGTKSWEELHLVKEDKST